MQKIISTLICLVFAIQSFAQEYNIKIYSITENGEKIEMVPIRHRRIMTVSKVLSKVDYAEFKGETSKTHFSNEAKFVVDMGNNPDITIDNLGVCLFKADKGLRYTVVKVKSNKGERYCNDYAYELDMTTKKISDHLYEVSLGGVPGEYGFAVYVGQDAGCKDVFDFTITADKSKESKYSIRERKKNKKIW